jgi:L-lactate dehydrogenase complex protein LldG
MSGARDAVLARIRHALAGVPDDERPEDVAIDRDYRQTVGGDPPLDLLADRIADYRATVHRCPPDEVAATVASICVDEGVATLIVPADIDAAWRPGDVEVVDDAGQVATELDGIDAVLTGCAVAIAETGTIVLDGGAAQGRRALTLVPDLHICLVRADQVVTLVTEGVARLRGAVAEGRPLTWISGPSATSDIELSRVEGVHGPRRLHVLLVA